MPIDNYYFCIICHSIQCTIKNQYSLRRHRYYFLIAQRGKYHESMAWKQKKILGHLYAFFAYMHMSKWSSCLALVVGLSHKINCRNSQICVCNSNSGLLTTNVQNPCSNIAYLIKYAQNRHVLYSSRYCTDRQNVSLDNAMY